MSRKSKIAAVVLGSVALLAFAVKLYASHWQREAGVAVIAGVEALAAGRTLPGLRIVDVARSRVSASFTSGYSITRYDNIGLGFRAYEVFVRGGDGQQYIFDAIHESGSWTLDCCGVRQ
jgi:hypothetical protein